MQHKKVTNVSKRSCIVGSLSASGQDAARDLLADLYLVINVFGYKAFYATVCLARCSWGNKRSWIQTARSYVRVVKPSKFAPWTRYAFDPCHTFVVMGLSQRSARTNVRHWFESIACAGPIFSPILYFKIFRQKFTRMHQKFLCQLSQSIQCSVRDGDFVIRENISKEETFSLN